MEIKNINISEISIPDVNTWFREPPHAIPPVVPVTVQIGIPIVDIPGCVEAHSTNNPRNDNLVNDDPKGTLTFCDAGVPSYNPMNFEPEDHLQTPVVKPPPYEEPETPEMPLNDIPKEVLQEIKLPCPTEKQSLTEPIGTVSDGGKKRIVDYKTIGKECIAVKEDLSLPVQVLEGLPGAGSVTMTTSVAVIATTSAILAKPVADVLLKTIKPAVKKVIKKVQKITGKKQKILSLKERRDLQRGLK